MQGLRSKLIKYLLIAFGFTWLCWWGDALVVRLTALEATYMLPMVLFTVGGFGPAIAACACLDGGFTWKRLGKFLTDYRRRSI